MVLLSPFVCPRVDCDEAGALSSSLPCFFHQSRVAYKVAIVSESGYETLDMSGVPCPMPLLKTKLKLKTMSVGEVLEVIATDSGSWRDIPQFIENSTHTLLEKQACDGLYRFRIERG